MFLMLTVVITTTLDALLVPKYLSVIADLVQTWTWSGTNPETLEYFGPPCQGTFVCVTTRQLLRVRETRGLRDAT